MVGRSAVTQQVSVAPLGIIKEEAHFLTDDLRCLSEMAGEGDISCEPLTGSLAPVCCPVSTCHSFNEETQMMFSSPGLCAQLSFQLQLAFPGDQRYMRAVSFHVSTCRLPLNPTLTCVGTRCLPGETVPMLGV